MTRAVDVVRFGYREGADVLHGISLDVAPGSRVALVGPSRARAEPSQRGRH